MCIGHSDGGTSMHLGFRASPKSHLSSTTITQTHPCTVESVPQYGPITQTSSLSQSLPLSSGMPAKSSVIKTISNHYFFLDLNRLSPKDSLSLSSGGWILLFSLYTALVLQGQDVKLLFFSIPISTYQQFLLDSSCFFEDHSIFSHLFFIFIIH